MASQFLGQNIVVPDRFLENLGITAGSEEHIVFLGIVAGMIDHEETRSSIARKTRAAYSRLTRTLMHKLEGAGRPLRSDTTSMIRNLDTINALWIYVGTQYFPNENPQRDEERRANQSPYEAPTAEEQAAIDSLLALAREESAPASRQTRWEGMAEELQKMSTEGGEGANNQESAGEQPAGGFGGLAYRPRQS